MKKVLNTLFYTTSIGVICICLLFIAGILEIGHTRGQSMMPTFGEETVILELGSPYCGKPEYNDVVSLVVSDEMSDRMNSDIEGKHLLKRVIGLPGDRVYVENGAIYVNNNVYEEDKSYYTVCCTDLDITLGENEYFVISDNKNGGIDSRAFGAVNIKDIYAKHLFTLLG